VATPVNKTPIFQSPFNKQRKDKFICVLTIPKVLRDKVKTITRLNNTVNFDSIQFSVFGTVVPRVEIPPVLVPFSGQTLKATSYSRPSFANLKVDFTVDSQFNNYWVIYTWLDIFNHSTQGIFDRKTGFDIQDSRFEEYMTNLTIYSLDEYSNKTAKFDYIHAFPVALEGINYSDRDSGEMECSFEFAYHQLKMSLVT